SRWMANTWIKLPGWKPKSYPRIFISRCLVVFKRVALFPLDGRFEIAVKHRKEFVDDWVLMLHETGQFYRRGPNRTFDFQRRPPENHLSESVFYGVTKHVV